MLRKTVLTQFPTWDYERQLKEYNGYKKLGDFSPLIVGDLMLMKMIMDNHNVGLSVRCDSDGVCSIIGGDRLDEALNKSNITKLDLFIHALFDVENEPDRPDGGLSDDLKTAIMSLKSKEGTDDLLMKSSPSDFNDIEHRDIATYVKDFPNKNIPLTIDKDASFIKAAFGIGDKITIADIFKIPLMKAIALTLIGHPLSALTGHSSKGELTSEAAAGKTAATFLYKINKDENSPFKKLARIKKLGPVLEQIEKRINTLNKLKDDESFRESRIKQYKNLENDLTAYDTALKVEEKKLKNAESAEDKEKAKAKILEIKNLIMTTEHLMKKFNQTTNELVAELDKAPVSAEEQQKKADDAANAAKRKLEKENSDTTKLKSDIFEGIKKRILAEGGNELLEKFIKLKGIITEPELNSAAIDRINGLLGTDESGVKKYIIELFHEIGKNTWGRGELLVAYLCGDNVVAQGPSQPFDIDFRGKKQYEVKGYDLSGNTMDSNGIRLGKDGKISGFEPYYDLMKVLGTVQQILDNNERIKLIASFAKGTDLNNREVEEIVADLRQSTDNGGSVYEIIKSGEITVDSLIKTNIVLEKMKQLLEKVKNNNFHYAKIVDNSKNIYRIVGEVQHLSLTSTEQENASNKLQFLCSLVIDEKETIKLIDTLLGYKFIKEDNFLLKILNQIQTKVNIDMEKHPLLLVSGESTNPPKIHGLYTDFVFVKISQGIVRISPVELTPSSVLRLRDALRK